jgi:hypothetical protein
MNNIPSAPLLNFPSFNFPQNSLTNLIQQTMPGTITSFSGDIDYKNKTYELNSSNRFVRMNFSPSIKNNTGWIVCVGCDVKKIIFPTLFQTIGFLYGAGTNDDEFKIPDYNGYFFRGLALDDKIDKGFNDRKINPANGSKSTKNGVGSIQEIMVQKHEHKYVNFSGKVPPVLGPGDSPTNGENKEVYTDPNIYSPEQQLLSGDETRPVNIYVNYLIFAGLPSAIKQHNM